MIKKLVKTVRALFMPPKDSYFERVLLFYGVPKEDIESVFAWAFGDDWPNIFGNTLGDRWRTVHSDLAMIEESMFVDDAFKIVAQEWLKREAA